MTYQYRYAHQGDLESLVQFVFHGFSDECKDTWGKHVTPDMGKMRSWIWGILGQATSATVIAVDDTDMTIAGALSVTDIRFPWSLTDSRVHDEFFIVGKEHRKSTIAAHLVKIIQELCDQHQKILVLAQISGTDVEKKLKFFVRMGLTWMGGEYCRFPKKPGIVVETEAVKAPEEVT